METHFAQGVFTSCKLMCSLLFNLVYIYYLKYVCVAHVIIFKLVFGDCPQLANLSWMCSAASRKAVLHLISIAKRSCSTSFTP